MQVSLIALCLPFALAAWWMTGAAGWLVGAVLIAGNLPVTFAIIMPVDRRLMATEPSSAGPQSRALILRWGSLHVMRTVLGLAATVAFVAAARA